MKVVVGTGGTGGHMYPAIAVANALKDKGHKSYLIIGGRPRVPIDANGIPVVNLPAGPILGKGITALVSIFKIVIGGIRAIFLLKSISPDLVLATGSYASAPVVIAAKIVKIPYFLMEQNVIPGLMTKKFEMGAKGVITAFPDTKRYLSNPSVFAVGLPLMHTPTSKGVDEIKKEWNIPLSMPVILTVGGSQGSLFLSRLMLSVSRHIPGAFFIIQTGSHIEQLSQEFGREGNNYRLVKFIKNMSEAYKIADIVISRAGGGAVAEISYFGKASILIPFTGAKSHQLANAQVLGKAEGAILIEEHNATVEKVTGALNGLLKNKEKIKEMGKKAQRVSHQDSVGKIVKLLEESV